MFKLERTLSPAEFKETFKRVNREDHKRPPHPWDLLFREGKCTREQLQGWAKERYYFVKQVPVKEYGILFNCPYPAVRRVWLTKAIEEEREDIIGREHKAHPEYWLKLCEGLGLLSDYVRTTEPLPGVKFTVDTFALMATKSWLLGIAVSRVKILLRGCCGTSRSSANTTPGCPMRRSSSINSIRKWMWDMAISGWIFWRNIAIRKSCKKTASIPNC